MFPLWFILRGMIGPAESDDEIEDEVKVDD